MSNLRLLNESDDSYYSFERVGLLINNILETNIFSKKNNKSLEETIQHKRYQKFGGKVHAGYSEFLDWPLGEFLLHLKNSGDDFYKDFLNRHGDLAYTNFLITDHHFLDRKGVYAYLIGEEVKYIGRCRDSMKKRVNQGYGKIHPKNCYLDGQSTNCHLNAKVAASGPEVTLWLHTLDDDRAIEKLERELISTHSPPWNQQQFQA